MKTILPVLDEQSSRALYLQLYDYIKNGIVSGDIRPDEKLPSLRTLSKSLGVSLTTTDLAYQQLQVEGYIQSQPRSGYYVNAVFSDGQSFSFSNDPLRRQAGSGFPHHTHAPFPQQQPDTPCLFPLHYTDDSFFDFVKWKKCINKILNDDRHSLLTEGESQGEAALRLQIAGYVYQSRGVRCTPEQIVIGAGTQQIMGLLCSLLKDLDIPCACFEDPGYPRAQKIFSDRHFEIRHIPVSQNGITLSALPAFPCSVYVTPSNQFPTGALMPIARRYELLEWAKTFQSIIIEDDYDSELRYFGRPVPSLQGLDLTQRVVYLGSFSSTLFPAIKVSYMILPQRLSDLFQHMKSSYTQTCSKTEQLTLALYLEKGLYQTHIKKLRKLYAQKLSAAIEALNACLGNQIEILGPMSGLHLLFRIKSANPEDVRHLCERAENNGIKLSPVSELMALSPDHSSPYRHTLIFNYTRIPLHKMKEAIDAIASC